MALIKQLATFEGVNPEKFYKTTLFRTDALLVGLNCLEPGQTQKPHDHADQDKFYYVVSGRGLFTLGVEEREAEAGALVWAPAGLIHGVRNNAAQRLVLLMGIAPAP